MKIDYPGCHSAVSIGTRQTYPVEDGQVVVPDDYADDVMDALKDAYDVEYSEDGTLQEDDSNEDEEDVEICGTEMSDGDICERPADECSYHNQEDSE